MRRIAAGSLFYEAATSSRASMSNDKVQGDTYQVQPLPSPMYCLFVYSGCLGRTARGGLRG